MKISWILFLFLALCNLFATLLITTIAVGSVEELVRVVSSVNASSFHVVAMSLVVVVMCSWSILTVFAGFEMFAEQFKGALLERKIRCRRS